jgi:hypothetical protein
MKGVRAEVKDINTMIVSLVVLVARSRPESAASRMPGRAQLKLRVTKARLC